MRTLLPLAAVLALASPAAAADAKPNLVFLFADDLGWSDVGFNGRKEWKTPHLDKFAKEGTVFTRWYTAGTVCAPSRAALMTGKYGIHNGVSGNSDDIPTTQTTLAEALKKHGYKTALFGKWHHGRPRPGMKEYRNPLDLGFDEFVGFTNAGHAWQHFPKELFFGREKKPVKGYAAKIFADQSIDFLKRHKDKPFFLYVPFTIPHLHIEALPDDVAKFKGKFKEADPDKPLNATYAAMVTALDRECGRVLKALDELKLADNTLVVFTSDHGATFEVGNQGTSAFHDSNFPFRGQKRTLWEGGLRVPAAARWPGQIPAGKKSGAVVHMTDVFPTFLAAAGAKPDEKWKVTGADMLDVWRGKAKPPERTLFWEWRAEGYHQLAAMRGDHKFVITGQNNPPELFNVVTDPAERRNVRLSNQAMANRLQKELAAWLETETEESKWGRSQVKKGKGKGKK